MANAIHRPLTSNAEPWLTPTPKQKTIPMAKPKNLKAALKHVEKTAEDKARDKKKGYAEGSPGDKKDDKKHAKRLLGKK